MKKIKIFLASSIEDLREDRLQVGDFIRQINEIYLDSNIHFSLIKCEDYDNSIVSGGKQQEYDREIRDSELVFFLFFRKVGEYTKHEFEIALEAFKQCQKPRIITYFKYITSTADATQEVHAFMQMLDQEMKHYYNTYGHIDTLKLGILMQIKLLQLDSAQVKLENGAVLLNGHEIVRAENVPMLHGNRTLRDLTEKRKDLQLALNRCRSDYLTDPTPEKEAAFFDASAALNRVSKELTAVEQETMALLTTVAEMTADGRVLTYRQKEALKHFNQGDYAAVSAILEDAERENELQRAEMRAQVAKQEIQGYVEEERLLIKTEMAQSLTPDRVERILAGYQKVVGLVEKYDLDKAVLFEYALLLYHQRRFEQAIQIAEKLRRYYEYPVAGGNEAKNAWIYRSLGQIYVDMNRYEDAEAILGKALELYIRLAEKNPEAFELFLNLSYTSLGELYLKSQRYEDAEEALRKASEIIARLVTQNPEAFEPALALNCNSLGGLYLTTQRYENAEEALRKASEIFARLVTQNPEAFEPILAGSYNNLGTLYLNTQRYEDAEEALRKASEIYARLVTRNPEAFEPTLAVIYNNLGTLYLNMQRYEDAEEPLGKASEIYARLVTQNPEAFEPALALSYNNLGTLYVNTQRYEDAEEALRKASEIYARLVTQNPEAFEPTLAMIYNNLGMLYLNTKRYEDAEEPLGKASEISARLVTQNPEAFEPTLALSYGNLGMLYLNTKRYEDAESALGKALDTYIRLSCQNLDAFGPQLVNTALNILVLYNRPECFEKGLEVAQKVNPLLEKLAAKYPAIYGKISEIVCALLEDV